jgi:hypothetical protein
MRSRNAAMIPSGAIASRRDRLRFAALTTALLISAALTACVGNRAGSPSGGPAAGAPAAAATGAGPASPIARVPAAPLPPPADLTGLGAAELEALLGAPDFHRSEPPAELWQYRGTDCILDIFLYDGQRGYRVVHAETRQRRKIFATGWGCSAGPAGFIGRHRQSGL